MSVTWGDVFFGSPQPQPGDRDFVYPTDDENTTTLKKTQDSSKSGAVSIFCYGVVFLTVGILFAKLFGFHLTIIPMIIGVILMLVGIAWILEPPQTPKDKTDTAP